MAFRVTLTTVTCHSHPTSPTVTQPRMTVIQDIAYSMMSRLSAPPTAAGLDRHHAVNVTTVVHSFSRSNYACLHHFNASQTSAHVGDCVPRPRRRSLLRVPCVPPLRPSLPGGCCVCFEQSARDSTIIVVTACFPQ